MEVIAMAEKKSGSSSRPRKPEGARQKNEGEGNRTAARQYNKEAREFVQSGQVDKAAGEAAEAINSDERSELEQAEREGRHHAKE
jgi:hypothetical protein